MSKPVKPSDFDPSLPDNAAEADAARTAARETKADRIVEESIARTNAREMFNDIIKKTQ